MADSSSRRRSRSPSPSRRAPKPSRGFRWKDSRPRESSDDRRAPGGGDARGRRDHRDSRDRDRDRDRERDRYERHGRYDRLGGRDRRPRSRSRSRTRSPPRRDTLKPSRRADDDVVDDKKARAKKAKPATAAASSTAGQEFIVVNVNDRLGTKTAIPCLASDTIGQFKLMLAARIGRDPGQIMLRRQGERPFKDPLTLEDYGISNGVQLDLEIDTGD